MSHSNEVSPEETYLAQRAADGKLSTEEYNAAVDLGVVRRPTFKQNLKEAAKQFVTGRPPPPELTERGRLILRGKKPDPPKYRHKP